MERRLYCFATWVRLTVHAGGVNGRLTQPGLSLYSGHVTSVTRHLTNVIVCPSTPNLYHQKRFVVQNARESISFEASSHTPPAVVKVRGNAVPGPLKIAGERSRAPHRRQWYKQVAKGSFS